MTKTIFRRLIIFWWLLLVVGTYLTLSHKSDLPIELSSYLDVQANAELTTLDVILAAIGFPLILGLIVASAGLYFFKKWSRSLFVFTNLSGLLLNPFLGPSIMSPWESSIWYVSSILTGGMLFVIYLPPLNQIFAGIDDLPDKDGLSN